MTDGKTAVKLGLFGGSFDPPHQGHLEPVKAALAQLGLDRVVYLPTAQPPHKPERRFAPAHARYTMVELALLAEPRLFASPFELTPGRRAYTVDTLAHFRDQHPEAELHYLVGSDSFAQLHTWRRWRQIPTLARLVVLVRPGWDEEACRRQAHPQLLDLLEEGRAVIAAGPRIDASSTRLRAALGRGEAPPPDVLPRLVLDYARKYRLYR